MKSAKRSGREAIDIETLKWSGLGYLSSFSGRCWEGREMFVGSWFQYSLNLVLDLSIHTVQCKFRSD